MARDRLDVKWVGGSEGEQQATKRALEDAWPDFSGRIVIVLRLDPPGWHVMSAIAYGSQLSFGAPGTTSSPPGNGTYCGDRVKAILAAAGLPLAD